MVEAIYELDCPPGYPPSHVSAEFMARLARADALARHRDYEPSKVTVEQTHVTGRWLVRIFYPDDACPT